MEEVKINQLESKKNNLFLVEFPEDINIPSYMVSFVNKPIIVNGMYQSIRISFNDSEEFNTSKALYNINKKKLNKFDFKIHILRKDNTTMETWIIKVEYISVINFGNLSYSDDSNSKPYMVVFPIDCELVTIKNGK